VLTIDRRKPPPLPVPIQEDESLDIPALIRGAVKNFSTDAMTSARAISHKVAKGQGIQGRRVPSEAAYHAELHAVLPSWLLT
jgi:hypothetical protein